MMNKLQLFIFLVCICMLAGCTEEEENSGIHGKTKSERAISNARL